MKYIQLTRGFSAIVDDEDYDSLAKHKWMTSKRGRYAYAVRKKPGPRSRSYLHMHRVIMGNPESDVLVDHINGNGLDNRKCNLRLCTKEQNQWNRRVHTSTQTGYKGVSRSGNGFRVRIMAHGNRIYLGHFDNIIDAANAYDNAALKIQGEFAALNLSK